MKAYSIDLRKKIIEIHEREKIYQRQLARRFGVVLSFIVKLLKQYRQTKELSPKPFNGGVIRNPVVKSLLCSSKNISDQQPCQEKLS